jgi:GTP-binding protein Era
MKVGYVSIVGKPNVGKSSLLNDIFSRKVSIVTKKAQTTRNAISNIYNDEDSQIIFVDTPGIHNFNASINRFMNKASYNSIRGADVTVLMFDASHKFDKQDDFIFEHLQIDSKLILVLNKIDETNIGLITELKNKLAKIYANKEYKLIEMSALRKFNVDELLNAIKEYLPEGPLLFDPNDEEATEEKVKFEISEIIREKILLILKEEVPHSIFIDVKSVNFGDDLSIVAKIIVEKDSQKGILIGKNGSMIKQIGINSRRDLEKEFKQHVQLDLTVTVAKNWRNDEKFLKKHDFLKIK